MTLALHITPSKTVPSGEARLLGRRRLQTLAELRQAVADRRAERAEAETRRQARIFHEPTGGNQ